MAKRKATSSGKSSAATLAKRRSAKSSNGSSSSPARKAVAQRPISSQEIGQVAGEIWGLLSNDGVQTLAALKKSVDAQPDIVVAALGWLAREDKLEFTTSGRSLKISLR